ncbi:DUF4097 family beta strand repeat-containing protein [Ilumatobacter sp.]|uniref:DUF4097 family beta strand repeat-containing protein n=1 Tax=Ilumatobacter sp. TaxID=1967498 RepID=UPI003AF94CEB
MSTRREELSVGEHPSIAIKNLSGLVEVRSGEHDRVVVTIEADDADEWVVTQLHDSISVHPDDRRRRRVRRARVVVELPSGSDVEIRSASADVVLIGAFGSTKIRTMSGDVRAGAVTRLDVDTASGAARADAVASTAACNTASGDVEMGEVGGPLTIGTASGNVRVALAADDVEIGTASGDVRIGRFDGSSLTVKCISGDVSVGLPSGIRVEPDISTLAGRTSLPTPSITRIAGERRVVRVGLRTVSGDITLERVDAN